MPKMKIKKVLGSLPEVSESSPMAATADHWAAALTTAIHQFV